MLSREQKLIVISGKEQIDAIYLHWKFWPYSPWAFLSCVFIEGGGRGGGHKMLSLKIPKPKSDLSMKLSLICTFSPLSGYFRVWFVSRNVIMMSFLWPTLQIM